MTNSSLSFLEKVIDVKSKEISRFITRSYQISKESSRLSILTDHVLNENIFHLLQTSGKMKIEDVRFYIAEVLLAFQYLFSQDACLSLLLPYNILLDDEGHVKLISVDLVDMNDSSEIQERVLDKHVRMLAEYASPELMDTFRFSKEANVWSIGIIIFEMLELVPPFYGETSEMTFKEVKEEEVKFPVNNDQFTPQIKDLVMKMLDKNPVTRIKIEDAMAHPVFAGIDWQVAKQGKLEPPFKPRLDDRAFEFNPTRIIWKVE